MALRLEVMPSWEFALTFSILLFPLHSYTFPYINIKREVYNVDFDNGQVIMLLILTHSISCFISRNTNKRGKGKEKKGRKRLLLSSLEENPISILVSLFLFL
jgi:hypothetical protein